MTQELELSLTVGVALLVWRRPMTSSSPELPLEAARTPAGGITGLPAADTGEG